MSRSRDRRRRAIRRERAAAEEVAAIMAAWHRHWAAQAAVAARLSMERAIRDWTPPPRQP